MIQIEKGVPIAPAYSVGRGPRGKYPFDSMAIGDSFLVQWDTPSKMSSVRACARIAARRTGYRFTVRKTREGIRAWRTA